jgi:hypothetical protein
VVDNVEPPGMICGRWWHKKARPGWVRGSFPRLTDVQSGRICVLHQPQLLQPESPPSDVSPPSLQSPSLNFALPDPARCSQNPGVPGDVPLALVKTSIYQHLSSLCARVTLSDLHSHISETPYPSPTTSVCEAAVRHQHSNQSWTAAWPYQWDCCDSVW